MKEKPRRGFTDRRARRLTANGVVVGLIAAPLMLLLASYWLAAPELGTYGWTAAWIVAGLVSISATCIIAAYRVQVASDRGNDRAVAIAAAWEHGPVEADPEPPPPPASVPTPEPLGPPPGPARAQSGSFPFLPPDQRPVAALPASQPMPLPAVPTWPDPEPDPARVSP